VLAIWPALVYALHRVAGERRGYWTQFTGASPFLDTGPMWFVEVLLIYSLGYAAWRAYRGRRGAVTGAGRLSGALSAGGLTRLAVGVSVATVLVRLVFPLASQQPAHPICGNGPSTWRSSRWASWPRDATGCNQSPATLSVGRG
jgi:hypothetical protein